MKKRFAVIALLLLSITAVAQETSDSIRNVFPDSIVISDELKARLDSLYVPFDENTDVTFDDISDNENIFLLDGG